MTLLAAHLLYAAAWLGFAAGHSLLASEPVKRRLSPLFGAGYRLAYNLVAVAHLAGVWLIGYWLAPALGTFTVAEPVQAVQLGLAVGGWAVFLVGLKGYDLGRLAGTRQLRNRRLGIVEPEVEPLRRDGLHRYIRHPLYAGGLMILWGVVDDGFSLATALWGSLYLVIGSCFEERWLLRVYGRDYADYRKRVPAFVPWRGRAY